MSTSCPFGARDELAVEPVGTECAKKPDSGCTFDSHLRAVVLNVRCVGIKSERIQAAFNRRSELLAPTVWCFVIFVDLVFSALDRYPNSTPYFVAFVRIVRNFSRLPSGVLKYS